MRSGIVLFLVCGGLALTSLSARGRAQNAAPARFEVESIRRNVSDGPSFLATKGDRFSATNFPLRLLILNAFQVQPNQLIGSPGWLEEHYDIIAKSPETLTPVRQREMIRALLTDRFMLVTHTETRELPIYTLVVARPDGRLGPRMSVSKNDCAGEGRPIVPPPRPPVCNWLGSPGSMTSGGIRIGTLVEMLSRNVGRQVVDRTGLTGFYDFELTFNPGTPLPAPPPPGAPPPPSIDPDAPNLFTALQEQLGLKLDAGRGPVEVLVIDRIERPTTD
jgi:uncharacterized protein (TIGR03435 family)